MNSAWVDACGVLNATHTQRHTALASARSSTSSSISSCASTRSSSTSSTSSSSQQETQPAQQSASSKQAAASSRQQQACKQEQQASSQQQAADSRQQTISSSQQSAAASSKQQASPGEQAELRELASPSKLQPSPAHPALHPAGRSRPREERRSSRFAERSPAQQTAFASATRAALTREPRTRQDKTKCEDERDALAGVGGVTTCSCVAEVLLTLGSPPLACGSLHREPATPSACSYLCHVTPGHVHTPGHVLGGAMCQPTSQPVPRMCPYANLKTGRPPKQAMSMSKQDDL